jgi:hypothetical protein
MYDCLVQQHNLQVIGQLEITMIVMAMENVNYYYSDTVAIAGHRVDPIMRVFQEIGLAMSQDLAMV